MEKAIIELIDKKASRQYLRLTESKRKAYRVMLYAGVQTTLNGKNATDIAAETGYSVSYICKLATKWIELMRDGDVTVNLIITAFHKWKESETKALIRKKKQTPRKRSHDFSEDAPVGEQPKPMPKIKPATPIVRKPKKVLGFIITPEDEARERAAIRASILFFQTYGKGRQPRMHGEYFTPGTNPNEAPSEREKWLPLEAAAMYCGVKEEIINLAGQNDMIERRVYKRSNTRNYYEYKVSDLDKFIRQNNLL